MKKFFISKKKFSEDKFCFFPIPEVPVSGVYYTEDCRYIGDGYFINVDEGWGYTSGWNGSFHAAYFQPTIFSFSKGKKKFRKANLAMQKARDWVSKQERRDIQSKIMSLKSFVRFE